MRAPDSIKYHGFVPLLDRNLKRKPAVAYSFDDYRVSGSQDNAFYQIKKTVALSALQQGALDERTRFEERKATARADYILGSGWKLHVSVNDMTEDNLARAWDVVADLMHAHGIPSAKMLRPDFYLYPSAEGTQDNKQITIYLGTTALVENAENSARIAAFITELNARLQAANVVPGPRPPPSSAELILSNSAYLSYRSDIEDEATGRYISGLTPPGLTAAVAYNRTGTADPFAAMGLALENPGLEIIALDAYRAAVDRRRTGLDVMVEMTAAVPVPAPEGPDTPHQALLVNPEPDDNAVAPTGLGCLRCSIL